MNYFKLLIRHQQLIRSLSRSS